MYVYPPNNYQNLTNQSGSDLASIFILIAIIIAVAAVSTGIYYGVKSYNTNTPPPTPPSTNTCEEGKTYDNNFKKCLRTCPSGYERIDDKDDCYIICENDKTRCGKNECIDLSQQSCIDDKSCKIQQIRNYKENSVSKKECCKDNEYVNKVKDSSDQICSTCDNTICGDKCCPKEIRSINPSSKDPFDDGSFENKNPGPICVNSKMCCDQNFISTDNICCQTPLCGTDCCDDNEGCYEGKCKTICGDAFCTDTEVCLDNGLGSQKCIPKGCAWNDIHYDPTTVTSYFTKENKPTFYTNNDFVENKYVIPTCSVSPYLQKTWWSSYLVSPNPNTPLYVTKDSIARQLQSKVMSTLDDKSNPKCQDPLACFDKIYQKGVTNVKDLTSVNDITVSGNKCIGKLSCDIRLPKISDIQNKCPIRNVDGTFSSQCCGDPNNFKGEVCPDSQICFYDGLNKCYSAVRDQNEYNISYCSGGIASVKDKQIVCDCRNLGSNRYGEKCDLTRGNCNNSGIPNNNTGNLICTCDINSGVEGKYCGTVILPPDSRPDSMGDGSGCGNLIILPGPGVTFSEVSCEYFSYVLTSPSGKISLNSLNSAVGGGCSEKIIDKVKTLGGIIAGGSFTPLIMAPWNMSLTFNINYYNGKIKKNVHLIKAPCLFKSSNAYFDNKFFEPSENSYKFFYGNWTVGLGVADVLVIYQDQNLRQEASLIESS